MEQISDQLARRLGRPVRGLHGLTPQALETALAVGGRFVTFEYCISLIVLTLRRPSGVWFVPAGKSGRVRGLPYTLVSLLWGWWGVPWGLIYTPLVCLTNLAGGRDVTAQVRATLAALAGEPGEERGRSCDDA